MYKPITSLLALAVVLAAAGLSACGGVPSDAVVQVDGTAISKNAFNHWMAVAATSTAGATATGAAASKPVIPVPPAYTACIAHLKETEPKPTKGQKPKTEAQLKSQCEQQYTQFKQQVLPFLITTQWVLGEANSLGVNLSDREVKKEFEKVKNQQFPTEEAFKKFLATGGESISDLLLRVKVQTLSQKIEKKVTEKAKATAAQARTYYNEHKSNYGSPEKRNVLIVLTKTEAQAKSAKAEISSGKSFASVAKSKSIDPTTKNTGGELKEVVKGQEEQALDTAIFAAKTGVLSGPVKTPFGYYVFEVKKIAAGNATSFTQVRTQVEQQLTAEQEQKALSEFVKNFRKKWEAKTECRSEYAVQDCKGYKAPSAPATPAVTSTPQTTTTPARTPKTTTGATKK